MRRGIILFIAAILFAQFATAQTTEVVAPSDSVDYLSPEEYAMMLDRNDRFLIRASLLSVGGEWGFGKKFSVFAQIGATEDVDEGPFTRAELRYYFRLKSVSRSKLNGPYISAGIKFFDPLYRGGISLSSPTYLRDGRFIFASLGLQRRFLGNGLADFGLHFGYRTTNFDNDLNGFQQADESYESFLLETKASIGLGLTFKKNEKLDYNRLCPILKCYKTESFLLKFNLANALRFEMNQHFVNLRLQPTVAVEQKLGDWPFSIQFKAALDRTIYDVIEKIGFFRSGHLLVDLELEGRYYYNLNSRIKKGKTGHNLSANYIGFGRLEQSRWYYRQNSDAQFSDHNWFFLRTGIQRTFGKRLYFDLYFGARYYKAGEYGTDFIEPHGSVECGFKF